MKKLLFSLLFLHQVFMCNNVTAQEKERSKSWTFGVYSSITPHLDTDLQSFNFIRKENVEWNDYYYDYVEGTFYSWNLGLKIERRILEDRLSLFLGVQYLNVETGMDADDYGSSSFMLVNVSQNDQGVEYLKVKGFKQSANYVGIPVGVKYTPLADHFANLYILTHVDFNFLMGHSITTSFVNPSMKKYNSKIESLFDDPTSLYTTFNLKGGVKLGSSDHPHLCIELGPTIVLSDEPSSITTSDVGFNFQINFILPL